MTSFLLTAPTCAARGPSRRRTWARCRRASLASGRSARRPSSSRAQTFSTRQQDVFVFIRTAVLCVRRRSDSCAGVALHLLHHVFDVELELGLALRQVLMLARHRLLLVDVPLNLGLLLANVFLDALQANSYCVRHHVVQ